ELVRDDLGVVRHLAGGIEIVTAPAHGSSGISSGIVQVGRTVRVGYFFWPRRTRSRSRVLSFMNSIIFSSTPSARPPRLRAWARTLRARSSSPEARRAIPRWVRVVGEAPSSLDFDRKSIALPNSFLL